MTAESAVATSAAVDSNETTEPPELRAAEPKDNSFVATFSNGVKAQLIGLSENPSEGKAWWTPDGSRLEDAPYARVPAHMDPGNGLLAREICWKWIDLPDDPDFETDWQILPGLGGCGGGIASDEKGKRIEGLTAWAIMPKSQNTCTLRLSVSISATPWTTLFRSDGHLSANSQSIDGVNYGVIFGKPYADNGGTSITVSYHTPGKDARLLAFGPDGLPEVGASQGGAGSLDFSQSTYHFAKLPPDKIERFEFQTQQRQFEIIEFRNVSLHPNVRTDVKIVRLMSEIERSQSNTGAAASVRPARVVTR